MPQVVRDMGRVPKALVKVFRGLVAGELLWPLFLYGPAGSTKTVSSLCLCDWAVTRRYTTAEELSSVVFDRAHHVWRDAPEPDCLWVLDELGARLKVATDPHFDAVKRLVDARELHADRVAIYISNLDPSQLARIYDDRLVDRITCGEVFYLDGPSRRRSE
jgi:hypothetical protein